MRGARGGGGEAAGTKSCNDGIYVDRNNVAVSASNHYIINAAQFNKLSLVMLSHAVWQTQFFLVAQQALVGKGLPWMSDKPDADTST
jgi:hypothetical protein